LLNLLFFSGLIKEDSNPDQVQEPTEETPVNPEPSTPDSIQSADDLDVTAFLEIQENLDQQVK